MRYDFSRDSLFHPETRPVFVGLSGAQPFDPRAAAVSYANGWWLAGLSHLAYYEANGVERELDRAGLDLVDFFDHEGTQGFVAAGREHGVLSFRGTQVDEVRDLLTDITFVPVRFGRNAKAHAGFVDALERVSGTVGRAVEYLRERKLSLWYTGHSLGAALVTLAAVKWPLAGVYTFGSPMVGHLGFEDLVEDVQVHRFVNCCDLVVALPPRMMRGYRHVGVEHFLAAGGKVFTSPEPGKARRLRWVGRFRYAFGLIWARPDTVKLRTFADHAIVNYTASLWRAMRQERKRR